MAMEFENQTILIVEDEPGTVEMYRIVLEVEGFRVRVAYTISSAISALEEEKPDLVLLDVVMRESSGLDLCTHIRETPELADLPIIIVSNLGSEEHIRAGMEAGADDYLSKPVSQSELIDAVHKGLKKNG
jgi:two-component system CheB/CheR fusion protein